MRYRQSFCVDGVMQLAKAGWKAAAVAWYRAHALYSYAAQCICRYPLKALKTSFLTNPLLPSCFSRRRAEGMAAAEPKPLLEIAAAGLGCLCADSLFNGLEVCAALSALVGLRHVVAPSLINQPLLGDVPLCSDAFAVCRWLFRHRIERKPSPPPHWQRFRQKRSAVLKVRAQLAKDSSALLPLAREISREHGVGAILLPGLGATWLRALTYTGFRIGAYPEAKRQLQKATGAPQNAAHVRIGSGLLTGSIGTTQPSPCLSITVILDLPRHHKPNCHTCAS
eukprot:6181005-Pleurochrysis_carterae.AAC.3